MLLLTQINNQNQILVHILFSLLLNSAVSYYNIYHYLTYINSQNIYTKLATLPLLFTKELKMTELNTEPERSSSLHA